MVDKIKNRKINITFLIFSYGLGGFEKVLKDLVDGFDKKKFDITVILLYPLWKSKRVLQEYKLKYFDYLSWYNVDRSVIEMKSPFHLHVILKLVKILQRQKTDALFFFALGMGTFIAPLAGVIAHVPVRIRTSANLLNGLYPRIFRPADSFFLKFIQKIVFPADFLKKEYLRNFNINENKISVIYNGVDVSLFSKKFKPDKIKNELGIDKKCNIIGIIANLAPVKSHQVLIHAVPSVIENYPFTKFLLIGEGPQENQLRELVSQLNIENNVLFLGYRSNIAQLISIFDIGVLCSKSEINPVSLLEIMAGGIPVIAPGVGGIPEIVKHEKNGLLFSDGNSDELSQCIIRLLANKKEANLIGTTGQKFVRDHFSLSKMIDNYQNLIMNLCGNDK